jgi:predicted lipoprotein with Yx(FWY)xxD motif
MVRSNAVLFQGWPAWLIASAAAGLLTVACGGGSGTTPPPAGNPPPASTNVQLASKAALGNYLVSAGGQTLYYFGLDFPGTASHQAVSNCTSTDGCLGVWPLFHVDTSVVGTGLQASDFAEITRPDGAKQTTYKGWPLYFYAGDSKAGDTNGDDFEGWFVLRDPFYSLLALTKSPTGATLFLADPQGRTVYTFADDTVGTAGTAPVSACTGACLNTWTLFVAQGTVTPTGIDATKLTTFTRPDGQMQSAFAGHPLYFYAGDTNPGDTNGQGFQGVWAIVNPSSL